MQDTGVQPLIQDVSHATGTTEAHALQLLSLCSRAWEPQLLKPAYPIAQDFAKRGKPAMKSPPTATRQWPPLVTQLEKLEQQQKTQHNQKQ